MIAHLLSQIPYEEVEAPASAAARAARRRSGYVRPARSLLHEVPDHAASLEAARSGPQ